MAVVQPGWVNYETGQDATLTVTLPAGTDVSGWTGSLIVRAYNGGPALITLTTGGSGLVFNTGGTPTAVGTFTAAQLALVHGPGAYVYEVLRTNVGFVYPIVDPSALVLTPSGASAYPTLTNLSEYVTHALMSATITTTMAQQILPLLAGAESYLQRRCGRRFTYLASATYYLDGTGTDRVAIPDPPCQSVVSVNEDTGGYYGTVSGSFGSTTLLTSGTDYALEFDDSKNPTWSQVGFLRRLGQRWPSRLVRPFGAEGRLLLSSVREPMPGCIKVVANTGFTLIPFEIKQAVHDLVTLSRTRSIYGRLPQSQSGEGYSRSFGSVMDMLQLPMSVQELIAMYTHGSMLVR